MSTSACLLIRMKTREIFFSLPRELIAQQPCAERGNSRLMVMDRKVGTIIHSDIGELASLLSPPTVVVMNDSRVRKARIFGISEPGGGRVEFLLLEEVKPGLWRSLAAKAKKQKPGKCYQFPGGVRGSIDIPADNSVPASLPDPSAIRYIRFDPPLDEAYLEKHGHIPLPPYIRRADTVMDHERYQTIYSRLIGSAAAPTAGLHLTETILKSLTSKGIDLALLTLHVGLGTFLPIRSENIEEHVMHREKYEIPVETAELIEQTRLKGGSVLAVGTTVVRALESAYYHNQVCPGKGETDIFIYPGYHFQVVDQLLTNFHTPESTLLLLVAAFAGKEQIMEAYKKAVADNYRFFSYGDAMLIQ